MKSSTLRTLALAATLLVPAQLAHAGWLNDSAKSTKKFINKHPWASALVATATVGGIGYGLYNWYTQPDIDDTEHYAVSTDQDNNQEQSSNSGTSKKLENVIQKSTSTQPELPNTQKKELIDCHPAILKKRADNLTEEELLENLDVPAIATIASEVIDKLNELLKLPLTHRAQRWANSQLKEWKSYQDHKVVISVADLKTKKDETLERIATRKHATLAELEKLNTTDKDFGIIEFGSDDITNLKPFPSWKVFETSDKNPAPDNPKIELVATYVPEWSDSESDDELATSQELGKSMLFNASKSFMATESNLGKHFKLSHQQAVTLEEHLEQITTASFAETLTENISGTLKRIKGSVDSGDIATEQAAIARGGAYAYQILIKNNFDGIPTKTIFEYQKAITDLQSFFYSLSFQKRFDGLGFVEGTFFIEDPSGNLRKFLEGYLATVQNAGHYLGKPDGKHLTASNPFAYYRANSHHFENSFGIDRRSEDGSTIYWMDKFGHILIGFNPKGVWFKPEKSGCGLNEVPSHALHLVEAQASKQTKKLIDGIEYLTGYKLMEMEGDDSPLYNKERIPTEVVKAFLKLFPDAKTETYGIHAMYAYANNQLSTNRVQPETVDAVQAFVDSLQKNYSKVSERQGSELYISQEDLLFAWGHATKNDRIITNFVSTVFAPLAYELNLYRAQAKFHGELDKDIRANLVESLRTALDNLITCAPVVLKKSTDETIQSYLRQTLAVCKYLVQLNDSDLLHEIENNSILETHYQAEKIRKLLAHPLAEILTQFEDNALALFNQFAPTSDQKEQKIEPHNKETKKAAKGLKSTIQQFTTRGLTQFQDDKVAPASMGTNFTQQVIDYADTISKDQLQDFLATCNEVETLWEASCKELMSAAHDYGMFTNDSPAIKKIKLSYLAKIKANMSSIGRAWADKTSDLGAEYLEKKILSKTESAEDAVRNMVTAKNQAEHELHKAFDNDFIEPFNMLWFFAPTVALYHAKLEQNFTTTKQGIDAAYSGANSIVDMDVPKRSDLPRHVAYRNFQNNYQELSRKLTLAKQQNTNK